jgi:hypothetical protein
MIDNIVLKLFCYYNKNFRNKNKINNFKYIEIKDQSENKEKQNYIVIKIDNKPTINCNICNNEIKDISKNNKIIKMSCCKYSNTICLNCIKTILVYKSKQENIKFNLFITMNCPFCVNEIYLLDMKPKHIKQILNNSIE